MKKLTHIFNIIILSITLLSIACAQSMEHNYEYRAWKAEEYNQNNSNLSLLINNLSLLPENTLNQFFFLLQSPPSCEPIQSLKNRIKTCMQLSMICKHFNKTLTFKRIGNLCKSYDQNTRNWTLHSLGYYDNTDRFSYKNRLPQLILICAGADDYFNTIETDATSSYALFYNAVCTNDTEFAQAVLEQHLTNPNLKILKEPLFFSAKTVEMAQLFIDNGTNVHAQDTYRKNVLWKILSNEYSSELITLYLNHSINAKECDWDQSNLLHQIGNNLPSNKNIDTIIKKTELLLKAIPQKINVVNIDNKTALDIIQTNIDTQFSNLEKDPHSPITISELTENAKKLISLFKKNGAFTKVERFEQKAKQAEASNQNNPLLALSHDVLNQIFCLVPLIKPLEYLPYMYFNNTPIYGTPPDQTKPLENRMKFFMKLKTVCKQFCRTLTHEAIGRLCKNYDQNIKDSALQRLTWGDFFANKNRFPISILISAGAQDDTTDFDKS